MPEFQNASGNLLSARIDFPPDDEPSGFAIFAHCFTCTKNLTAIGRITRALAAHGIATLRFDFTGLGESEGSFADTHFSTNVDDIVAAAAFLEAEYEAPGLLVGHSLGGTAILRAAERIPSAKAVATIAAPATPEHVRRLLKDSAAEIERAGEAHVDIGGRPFRIRKSFLDDLDDHPMEETIASLNRALLVLHAPMDLVVGIENAAQIFQAARHPRSYVSLDEADHLLTSAEDASYAGNVIATWAARYVETSEKKHEDRAPSDNRIVARTGSEGYRTEIMANGHSLVADEPLASGGHNAGPTPYNLLGAALASCTAMTLRMYADRKGWPLTGVTVRIAHNKVHAKDCEECEDRDGRIDLLRREIDLAGELDEAQQTRLLEIARRCPVHRTLEDEVVISDGPIDETEYASA